MTIDLFVFCESPSYVLLLSFAQVCPKIFFVEFEVLISDLIQVDLTQYVEKHEFVFDAVLNEEVSNDEVIINRPQNS